MPKVGAEPVRRAQTINAALECICEYGIDKMTLDMVAAKADFSKGIVCYYFKSKKQLIEESMKAFMESYKLKIGGSIHKDMQPLEMINTIVEVSLPRIEDQDDRDINVSTLEGNDKICLPQKKIAKLFIQFMSKAANDDNMQKMINEIYVKDVEGISLLMNYVRKTQPMHVFDDDKAAYTLLAMIYGLSFFRTINFMPESEKDNREMALNFIKLLFEQSTV